MDADTYLRWFLDERAEMGWIAVAGDVAFHPMILVVDIGLVLLIAFIAAENVYRLGLARSRRVGLIRSDGHPR
jgi:hypothetical protein